MSHLQFPAGGGLITGFGNIDAILNNDFLVFEPAIFLAGADIRPFSVLGRIEVGAATSAVKASGANTGNGTFVIDATTPTLANAIPGIYTLRNIEVVVNGGKFQLLDPKGRSVGVYIIVAGAGGTVTIADQIKGVLTDGGTDFALGDGFDITVPVGSLKYKLSAAAALDGSQVPAAINYEPIFSAAADKNGQVIVEGYFNEQALVYGAGHTADTVRAQLRSTGIHLKTMRHSG